jgi:hypothetical protein
MEMKMKDLHKIGRRIDDVIIDLSCESAFTSVGGRSESTAMTVFIMFRLPELVNTQPDH